jgi:hypothetical protein
MGTVSEVAPGFRLEKTRGKVVREPCSSGRDATAAPRPERKN